MIDKLTLYARHKAAGRCGACGKRKPIAGQVNCKICREKNTANSRKQRSTRLKTKVCIACAKRKPLKGQQRCKRCSQIILDGFTKRRKVGRCFNCNGDTEPGRRNCASCRARINAVQNVRKQQIRREVIQHYGGKCACCDEPEFVFLEMDHINNDGAEHRKRDPGAIKLCEWLYRHKFPAGFQALCANCHRAKTRGVICPHKQRKTSKAC